MFVSGSTRRWGWAFEAVVVLWGAGCVSRRPAGPLERIEQIASLPVQADGWHLPVHIAGWVTVPEPSLNVAFIEDGTGAARIELPFAQLALRPGARVEVTGIAVTGGPSPTVVAAHVALLDGKHEPRPLAISIADVLSGRAGFRYVELEGVLRQRHFDRAGRPMALIASRGAAIEAHIGGTESLPARLSAGARVRVRAVASVSRDVYGNAGRVQLWTASASDFVLVGEVPPEIPLQTARDISSLVRAALPERMLHLRGTVRSDRLGEGLVLTDHTGSIRLKRGPAAVFESGAGIDVFGFADADSGGIQIVDAVMRPANLPQRQIADNGRVLTSIAQVHALGAEEAARSIPVRVRATVTYVNPTTTVFFLQDETGGAFAVAPRIRDLQVAAGDLVDVTGVTGPGNFAPVIQRATATRVSAGSMPRPASASFDDLFSGKQDSAWVRTQGVVQSLEDRLETETAVWLQWGQHRYIALVSNPGSKPLPPPDTRVEVSGVCAPLFNTKRQILGIRIYVPSPRFVRVLSPAQEVGALPVRPINALLRFSTGDSPERRARIRGVVTLANPRGPTYVRDAESGLKIRDHSPLDLAPGDIVDVIGFAHAGDFSAEMWDAAITRLQPGSPPLAAPVTVDQVLEGTHDAELVEIDAFVVDELTGTDQNSLVLQAGGKLFHATLDRGQLPAFEPGSIVRLTGVCSIESGGNLAYLVPKSFTILLRSPADVAVVKAAPWWTTGHLLAVLGSMAAFLLAVLAWVAILRRRVYRQTAFIRDKLEQEASLKEAAQQASRAKSEFLANMSHEIRTPLNGILGFTSLMAASQLTDPQREYNEAVRSSAEALLVVINDILDFSRIEAGRLDLESADFSLRKCLDATVRSIEPLAAAKGLQVATQVNEDVPDWVCGDQHRLRQVLLNLAGNAIKFTETGRITVRVSVAADPSPAADPSATTIQFAVSDTGIGIPLAQQALIFQPFRQADGSITRRFGGSGLGLSISCRLVEMMNGGIWLESREGVGSTFFFTVCLPRGKAAAPAGPDSAPPERPPQAALSILVAEDNTVNQRLIRHLLEARGHRVTIAGDGAAALEAWRGHPYQLILMDLQMPHMDGIEATRHIRAEEPPAGPHVPIIALTAHAMKGDSDRCLEAGMNGYLAKPIRIPDLDRVLTELGPGVVHLA
jgi:signal transduction histidine kinase/CheY-like chemotaxis protein